MAISVVTPSLNQSNFARFMLASLLQQNCRSLEHIVFDAGSTDGTQDIWMAWQSACAEKSANPETPGLKIKAKVFVEPDDGQSHAINKGMKIATGDVVGWLNADDVLMPGALEKVEKAFDKNEDAVAVCGVGVKLDRGGNVMREVSFREFDRDRLRKAFEFIQPAIFFRRSAFRRVGGLDETLHYAMDWDLLLKLSKIGKIITIPERVAGIRCYAETKTNTGGWKRAKELACIGRKHNGLFDRNWVSFRVRTILARQPLTRLRTLFDHICWNLFKDPPIMVQGWPR